MTGLSEKDRALMDRTLDNVDQSLLTPTLHQEIILSRLLQAARSEGQGAPSRGWLYHCPDTGTEWSDNHPLESGEVSDARDVRPATLDALHAELMAAWEVLAERISPPDPQARIEALETERDHWKRIAHDRLVSANEQLARAREAEASLAVCRQTIAEQASARLDPAMPLLIERVVTGLREEAEVRYAMAETLEERQEAHGLAMLCDWQDARRAAHSQGAEHG